MGEPLTEAERETIDEIDKTGFHLDTGRPCECGGDDYRTRTKRAYSDSLIFKHKCRNCGNKFTTWIEG